MLIEDEIQLIYGVCDSFSMDLQFAGQWARGRRTFETLTSCPNGEALQGYPTAVTPLVSNSEEALPSLNSDLTSAGSATIHLVVVNALTRAFSKGHGKGSVKSSLGSHRGAFYSTLLLISVQYKLLPRVAVYYRSPAFRSIQAGPFQSPGCRVLELSELRSQHAEYVRRSRWAGCRCSHHLSHLVMGDRWSTMLR
jgi:hypothetical protein